MTFHEAVCDVPAPSRVGETDPTSGTSSGVVEKFEEKSTLDSVPSRVVRKRVSVPLEFVGSKRRLQAITSSSRRHHFQFESNISSNYLV